MVICQAAIILIHSWTQLSFLCPIFQFPKEEPERLRKRDSVLGWLTGHWRGWDTQGPM